MANFCKNCGKQLSFLDKFTSKTLCDDCHEAVERELPAQLLSIEESIKARHTCTQEQQLILQQYDRETVFDFYYDLCHHFATANGFEERNLDLLSSIQRTTKLSQMQARRAQNFAVAKAREEEDASLERAHLEAEYKQKTQLKDIEGAILKSCTCTADQLEQLKTYDRSLVLILYSELARQFIATTIDDKKIETLLQIQQAVGLTDKEVTKARQQASEEKNAARLNGIEYAVKRDRKCTPEQLEQLKHYDHKTILDFYDGVYEGLIASKELSESDVETLVTIQRTCGLTERESHSEELIRPYQFVWSIRSGSLPVMKVQDLESPLILRQGETLHYAHRVYACDVVNTAGHLGRTNRINCRVLNGVDYRIGAHKHYSINQNQLAPISPGLLAVTSQRIFLQPDAGYKPVNIPLNNVLSYDCYRNGIEIWRDLRQKAFFFATNDVGAVELFGLCLGFLLHGDIVPSDGGERNPFRQIPTDVKNRVLARDGYRCVTCGSSIGIHFDHIIPIEKGGDNTEANIQILCKDCNLRKSDKIL